MSLILEGIDMPMETDYLRLVLFRSGRDNEVLVFDDETNALIGQAIQIPKGHGNLKDDKEILARAEQEVDGLVMSVEHLPMVLEWILDKSDTFLEAEE